MIGREDYKRLALPVAVAVILIAIGASAVLFSQTSLEDARKSRDGAKKAAAQAQERVDKIAEEEREIKENMAWYARMASRGMVEQENRLDLIEAIGKIKTSRKLFEIKYNIEAQKPLGYPGVKPAGELDLVVSRMRLEMQLLHEEDLLKFLADLEAAALSHVSVRRCSLDRIDRGPAQSQAVVPRLNSICEVDFVVVKKVKS